MRLFTRIITRTRWLMGALTLLLALTWALHPAQAVACYSLYNPTDLTGCIDLAQYRLWEGIAGTLWSLDSAILAAAYYAHVVQVTLVLSVFPNVYGAIVTLVAPLLGPLGQLVLVVALLLVIALPIIGRVAQIDLKTTVVWLLLGPVVLGLGSSALQDVERTRIETTAAFFQGVAEQTIPQFVGSRATLHDIGSPEKLSPASGGCGRSIPSADFPDKMTTAYRVDELVASTLFFADIQDLFCPEIDGPGRTLPDTFYAPAPTGPGFAESRDVGMLEAAERTTAISNIQRGVTRLSIGILPSCLALIDALISLIFTLALIVLWLTLPICILLAMFQGMQPILTLAHGVIRIFTVSISCSIIMGLGVGAFFGVVQGGDAEVVIGVAIVALFAAVYVLMVAFSTIKDALGTVNSIAKATMGVGLDAPVTSMAQGALTVGAAVASGGAGLATAAAVGNEAFRASGGSNSYSTAAVAGRFRPVMAVGETLAKIGLIDTDGETYKGLRLGAETARPSSSMYDIKRSVKRDLDRKGADGLRLVERREQRAEAAAARIVHSERDRALLRAEDGVIQSGKVHAIQQNAEGEIETAGYETRRHDRSVAKRNELDMPKLLDMGYAYRPHDDGQIEFWNPNDTSEDADEIKALRGRQKLIDAGVLANDGGATAQRLAGEIDFAAQRQTREQRKAAAFDQRLMARQATNDVRPRAAHASPNGAGPRLSRPAAAQPAQPAAAERADAAEAAEASPPPMTAPTTRQDAIPPMPPYLATRRRIAYRGFQHDRAQPVAVSEHLDGTIQATPARAADEIPATAEYAAIGTDVAPLLAAGATVQPAPEGQGIVSWSEVPADAEALEMRRTQAEQRLQRLEQSTAQVRQQSYERAAAQIMAGDRAAAARTVAQAQRRLASLTARSQRVQAQLTQAQATLPQPSKASD